MEDGGALMPFNFLHLHEVDSTNAFLLRMQESVGICGCVLSADVQTAGKGMGSNSWESESGKNLTFSMGMDLSFMKAANQFLLSQAVPLGLLDVLEESLPPASLTVKWPNDLYYQDRKLCGILINSTIQGLDMGTSVVGIGLNVNQMQFQEWPSHPVSMKMILGKEVALEPLLKRLVDAVDRRVQLLRTTDGMAKVEQDYLNRLYRYHTWSDYEVNGQKVKRFITGIDVFGRLETLDESNQKCVYDIKEIKFL